MGGLQLRLLGRLWVLAAFGLGVGATALWLISDARWQDHLTRGFAAGFGLYDALRDGTPPPPGITITPLPEDQQQLADAGRFAQIKGLPRPIYLTHLSVLDDRPPVVPLRPSVPPLQLTLISPDLRYKLAGVERAGSGGENLGQITRLLASYCSEPVVLARWGGRPWQRIDADPIWSCKAAPTDLRLPAAMIAALGLMLLLVHVAMVTEPFGAFARTLRDHRRLGGPETYPAEGPAELRDMVDAVNGYLAAERTYLSNRAMVLSGISHDLGTPATRLRLRSALIEDPDLRDKLGADIDRMTGMIESALTYTQAELLTEEPRRLSLSSLLQAIVDDYADMDAPVSLVERPPAVVRGAPSVFMSRAGIGALPETRRVVVTARPVLLQRAITNLIDNALKYGRCARLWLEPGAQSVDIIVEDEGSGRADQVEALTTPFSRGARQQEVEGFGLGLAIVQTIAHQHGGRLQFEDAESGLRAVLTIQR